MQPGPSPQPPSQQQPYQPYTQPYPPAYPPTYPVAPPPRPQPPRARSAEWVIVIVVVVVIVLAIFFAVILPGLQSSAAQPSITVSNPQYSDPGCGLFGSYQTVTFTFTLVNTGDAAGVAVMTFYMDQSTEIGSQQYTILAHSSQDLSAPVVVNDCLTHTFQYDLSSVTKA